MKTFFVLLFSLGSVLAWSQPTADLNLKISNGHPMQYYVSLPKGWNANKQWPVIVILEAADKEYKKNAERFISERGNLPFILVAPFNTNNGNHGRRDTTLFPYSKATWDYMDEVGDCKFNDDGILQIIKDIRQQYRGEEKVYLTGFEAGTHALWPLVFNHPEVLKAVAPVAGNYRNRCVNETELPKENLLIPIRSFVGSEDLYFGPNASNYMQWTEVKKLAEKAGFKNISESVVQGKNHVPFPAEVLSYFGSLLK